MKFFLQWDGPRKSRAHRHTWSATYYTSINKAIKKLKEQENPHRLCYRENGRVTTLILWEGKSCPGNFKPEKIKACIKVGPRMYVPTRLTRKTTIKRKKKCKKSSLLNSLKASQKSTT